MSYDLVRSINIVCLYIMLLLKAFDNGERATFSFCSVRARFLKLGIAHV